MITKAQWYSAKNHKVGNEIDFSKTPLTDYKELVLKPSHDISEKLSNLCAFLGINFVSAYNNMITQMGDIYRMGSVDGGSGESCELRYGAYDIQRGFYSWLENEIIQAQGRYISICDINSVSDLNLFCEVNDSLYDTNYVELLSSRSEKEKPIDTLRRIVIMNK